MTAPIVALAVSGHGFGHAVRCAEVARALTDVGARTIVRTDAPRWLFPETVEHLPSPGWPLDVGVAQHDGLDLDVDETRRRWAAFADAFDARADAEAQLLAEHRVAVVLGDIPPLVFAAASRANVPGVALANFGWDWIYAEWPNFDRAVNTVRGGYRHAEMLLRLPLHSPDADAFCSFETIEDVPLIARRAQHTRCQVRAQLGLDQQAPVVLLSFGGFTAHGLDVQALGRWRDYTFVLTPPMSSTTAALPDNVLMLAQAPTDYTSLLAACDVVVTKPGYGVVADCLANRVSVLYTDRGPFREYDVLTQALATLGRARHVPRADVLGGQLGPHLDALLASSVNWTTQDLDGAQCVARRLLEFIQEK